MIPKGLKVGSTFVDDGMTYKVTKVVGDNYESIWAGATSPDAPVGQPKETKAEVQETKAEVRKDEDYLSMPYAQLKKLCADKGLDATGKKTDLIARLEG